ncbi:unnamed protein product, partial [Candidula unifasciata]
MNSVSTQDQWLVIQQKTFLNWANEHLIHSNRSIDNLASDLCDGVNLVALVEALQYQKIGKVYSKPSTRIQMLHNVSLALQAIADDNVKLVNIGTDDIVGGNLKLILGLLWRLIIRYQITSSKAKAPPSRLMLTWFQNALRPLTVSNFTTDWKDGIALHALLEFCKPGLSPHWRQLSPNNSLQNCRLAMQLAKDHLAVPKMISAEDFCSPNLDEQSAMTYLSYFIRKSSPGYYGTLNWICKQLKTPNISNLTTDWNDGYYLCALVHSFGGEVKGWPQLERRDHIATCQLGLDGAQKLGVEPMFTASELADPSIDHLTLMVYLSKFKNISQQKSNTQSCVLDCQLQDVTVGNLVTFQIVAVDSKCKRNKVEALVTGPSGPVDCQISWGDTVAMGSFLPLEEGSHQLHVLYGEQEIDGCPVNFIVGLDINQIQVNCEKQQCPVGQLCRVQIACSREQCDSVYVRLTSPSGEVKNLDKVQTVNGLESSFQPNCVGKWKYEIRGSGQQVIAGEVHVYEPELLTVADERVLDQENTSVLGFPKNTDVEDHVEVFVSGEGISQATRGQETYFTARSPGRGAEITADLQVCGQRVPCSREMKDNDETEFCYVPTTAGTYTVHVYWQRKQVAGSPFTVHVIDRSQVTLVEDLRELTDDNGRLALEYGKPTELNLDVALAGPGIFKAEVLSPGGKLPVDISQTEHRGTVSFVTLHEGDHYIHLYWSHVPLEFSPLHAYCPGPPLPIDASKVRVEGHGAEAARATVPAEFIINGMQAGPGAPRVRMQGIHADLPVVMKALKYDRYLCRYTSTVPGSFLLYVYWSDQLLPTCPFKVAVNAKGDASKVWVSGEGLRGGIANHELMIFIDTREAGPGEVTADCHSNRHSARCDIKEEGDGGYTLRVLPTESEKHVLHIKYDGQHVP